MRRLVLLALAAVLAAVLAAGCGSRQAPATDAAELVPADATAYVVVAPNGLSRARTALAAFGAPANAIPYLRAGRTARVAGGIVAFAQPADTKAFDRRLDRLGDAHARLRGWTVYASTKELVDAVRHSKRSLAATARYRRANGLLSGDALVRAYVAGPSWRAAALAVHGRDAKLEVYSPAVRATAPRASLADEIPASAVVAISSGGGALPPGAGAPLRALSHVLGADLGPLLAAADGPFTLYASPGAPVPEVTFATAAPASRVLLRRLRTLAGALAGTVVPKPPAAIDLGPVTLTYGLFAGRVVLSDAGGIAGGPKLTESPRFRAAADAAGLPAAGDGFFYVDAKRTLAAVRVLSALASRPVPPAVEHSLAPLTALLDWEATRSGVRAVTYLRVS